MDRAIEVRDLAAQIIDPFGGCDRAGEDGAFDLFDVGFEVRDDGAVALDHLVQDCPEHRVSAQCKQFGVLFEPRARAVQLAGDGLRNRCLDTGVLDVVTHASESVSPPVVGMRFGYTQVSTVAQTLHQQHDALKAAGASKIHSDTMSGARDDRPGLAALMDQLRAGDTVVVWKLDRLGRNMLHILETVKALTGMGVTLVSTSDGIDSSTAAGRMMIGVLGSLAEYERELIRERTA